MVETLEISSQDISLDGRVITPQVRAEPERVSTESVRQALDALAAQPPLALVDVDARLFLSGPGGTIAVRNNGGRLFACQLPELNNVFIACSPAEAVSWAQDSVVPTSGSPADEVITTQLRPAGWRAMLGSPWLLAVTGVFALFVGYLNFSGEGPEDIQILGDPAAIAVAQGKVQGSYAVSFTPGQTVMTVEPTALRIEILSEGGRMVPQAVLPYRFGRRQAGGQLVLVADNGAVLEVVSATGLRYGNAIYERRGSAHP